MKRLLTVMMLAAVAAPAPLLAKPAPAKDLPKGGPSKPAT